MTKEEEGGVMTWLDEAARNAQKAFLNNNDVWDKSDEGARDVWRKVVRAALETPTFGGVMNVWWRTPMELRRRWWAETESGKKPPSDELLDAFMAYGDDAAADALIAVDEVLTAAGCKTILMPTSVAPNSPGMVSSFIDDRVRGLVAERDQALEAVAQWAIKHSLPTGHGDTIGDILDEAFGDLVAERDALLGKTPERIEAIERRAAGAHEQPT